METFTGLGLQFTENEFNFKSTLLRGDKASSGFGADDCARGYGASHDGVLTIAREGVHELGGKLGSEDVQPPNIRGEAVDTLCKP